MTVRTPRRAAAIGAPDPIKREALVSFCVLTLQTAANDELAGELKESIARELGKALAPRAVLFVRDLPKTRNAKLIRRLVRCAYLNQDLGDVSSLENPAALDDLRRLGAPS